MAFTEVELAILSKASYFELPDSAEQKPLYDFLNDNKKSLTKQLGDGYASSIDSLLQKVEGQDYTIVQTRDDKDGTGFAAMAISDPGGGVTVACRGTEGFSLDYDSRKDVIADIELVASLQTCQQKEMEKFVKNLEQSNYSSYSFTGHSLGGNLAMYGAICLTNPNKLGTCTTFNAPGFNAAFLERYKVRISRIDDRMISFQNERDCVSEAFNVPGQIVILECDGWDCLDVLGIDAHMLETLVPNADGTFKRNRTGKKDTTVVGYVLDQVTGGTDITMGFFAPLTLTYGFFKWRQEEAKVICRDFSRETREMLLDVAREVEEEKWWQISRWDCWYKLDKFFGGLAADWDRYSGNVDTYYRKLIDTNDASAKDIKKIFDNVYTIDSSYAKNIKNLTQQLGQKIRNELQQISNLIVPKVIVHENYSIPKQAYLPVSPKKTNAVGERSPEAYNEVMEAFEVSTNPRYQPRNGDTWCNIYVWDVTTAMGCEIPHYYNKTTGAPMTRSECLKNPGTYYEMSASRMTKWLEKYGAQYGWVECDEATAINSANQGMPTVTVGTDTGHVAMVAPQKEGETGVMISQAGGRNFEHGKLSNGFGKHPVKYFYHP